MHADPLVDPGGIWIRLSGLDGEPPERPDDLRDPNALWARFFATPAPGAEPYEIGRQKLLGVADDRPVKKGAWGYAIIESGEDGHLANGAAPGATVTAAYVELRVRGCGELPCEILEGQNDARFFHFPPSTEYFQDARPGSRYSIL